MSFETNLKKLEETVLALESGDLPLEKAVDLYSKGMKLSLSCREELQAAKLRVTGDTGRGENND